MSRFESVSVKQNIDSGGNITCGGYAYVRTGAALHAMSIYTLSDGVYLSNNAIGGGFSGKFSVSTFGGVPGVSSGEIDLITGDGSATTGGVQVKTGSAYSTGTNVTTGGIQIKTGDGKGTGPSGDITIQTGQAITAGVTSGAVYIKTSDTVPGSSGNIELSTGAAGATGKSGDIKISTRSGTGPVGSIYMYTEDPNGGGAGNIKIMCNTEETYVGNDPGGFILLNAGNSFLDNGGQLNLNAGRTDAAGKTGGSINIFGGNATGTTGTSGGVTIKSGNSGTIGVTGAGSTGGVTISSGDIDTGSGGLGLTQPDVGRLYLRTGSGGYYGGDIYIQTLGAKNAGAIDISTGSATNFGGNIKLHTGNATAKVGDINIYTTYNSATPGNINIMCGTLDGVIPGYSGGDGGSINITAGGSSSGFGGGLNITSGPSISGPSGVLSVRSGDSGNGGTTGAVAFGSGSVSGGTNGSGGAALFSGNVSNTFGVSGSVEIRTGTGTTGGPINVYTRGTIDSGDINIHTGSVSSNVGALHIYTGQGGGSNNGNITIISGSSDGTTQSSGINGSISLLTANGSFTMHGSNPSTKAYNLIDPVLTFGMYAGPYTPDTHAGKASIYVKDSGGGNAKLYFMDNNGAEHVITMSP